MIALFFIIFCCITYRIHSWQPGQGRASDEAQCLLGNNYCNKKSCAQLLDVSLFASQDDFRSHYRALAKKLHPDKNKDPQAQEAFIALTQCMRENS